MQNEFRYSDILSWEEFYNRYVYNYEEFVLYYKNKTIFLITDYKGFLYTMGTDQEGYKPSKIYQTPQNLLRYAKFDGKSLKEIWDELK